MAMMALLRDDSLAHEDSLLRVDGFDYSPDSVLFEKRSLKQVANRLLYSSKYKAFYVLISAGSIAALVLLVCNRGWYPGLCIVIAVAPRPSWSDWRWS